VRRAFTLIEVLVVVGILAVLAGLLFPVFKHAKRSAQIAAAVENLRQHQIAASLYRSLEGRDGEYGSASEMGLPPPNLAFPALGLPLSAATSPCTPERIGTRDPYNVTWWPSDIGMFREQCLEYRERMILVSDMSCNDAGVLPRNQYQTRLGLAVDLTGSLIRRRATGNPDFAKWWIEP